MSDQSILPTAHGTPLCKATFRQQPEDFIVNEQLIFEPEGEGEHVYLQIRKRNTNTQWLAKQLAIFSGIKQRDVSYAGLKDRNAVTTQWFSLILHKDKEPDWQTLQLDDIEILRITRHRCKLRPGMVKINHFIITLRDIDCTEQALLERIELIQQQGVPNYFGEQRFGHGGDNIEQARRLFAGELKIKDRKLKGIYLSAARSYLFNKILAERVVQANWNKASNGDCMNLDGSNSFFAIDQVDTEIEKRINVFDIHPTGPMWGKGDAVVSMNVLQLENKAMENEQHIQQGLNNASMKMDRRPLRMQIKVLAYEMSEPTAVKLMFDLGSGQYATVLLREIFSLQQ